jgi:hypothetical protein
MFILFSGYNESEDLLPTFQSVDLSPLKVVRQDWEILIETVSSHIKLPSGTVTDLLPFESFSTVLGIIHLNSIELPSSSIALMRYLSFMNHSCKPNVKVCPCYFFKYIFTQIFILCKVIDHDGEVQAIASTQINAGNELLISYTDPTLPFQQRRHYLFYNYGFVCDCSLCQMQNPNPMT